MALFGQSMSSNAGLNTPDFQMPSAPTDGISSLCFNPGGNLLIAGSWDNAVRCWELHRPQQAAVTAAQPKAQMNHEGPVLSAIFSPDGSTVFSGSADKTVKMWNLGDPSSTGQVIGKHEQPVKAVRFIPEMSLVASGSWDKTIKFWDARQPNPTHSIDLPERCYAMDIKGPWVVAATANKQVLVYNLGQNCNLESCSDSTLKAQTRTVSIFPDMTGFALGSIEGRVAIEYFEELPGPRGEARPTSISPNKKSFAFKCHRETPPGKQQMHVSAVNCVDFCHLGTFLTAGSDGCINTWDKDSRQRLKAFPKANNTISTATFSPDAKLLAYAASYDWSQGGYVDAANPSKGHAIYVHATTDEEIKPREKKK